MFQAYVNIVVSPFEARQGKRCKVLLPAGYELGLA